ncbi:MAG: hypothetical protein JW940_10090 [Polyangiaceae bacterium]|nr:hypothetical protein [Polyangiaceae bacterium]
MKRQSRVGRRYELLTALVAIGVGPGCASKGDVLTSSDGGGGTDGRTDWSLCATDPAGAQATMGDACSGNACFANGTCWSGSQGCVDGVLFSWSVEGLDCSEQAAEAPAVPTSWSDCVSALEDGRSGDACTFPYACSRPTQDPCCIELASCSTDEFQPAQLGRYRFCAPSCTRVSPDTSKPLATGCEHQGWGLDLLGAPCQGSFVCILGDDVTASTLSPGGGQVSFCAAGLVVGDVLNTYLLPP